MVSYHAFISVDLSQLNEAASKWRSVPEHFIQIRTNFQNEVQKPLVNSDWEGEAANAAENKFRVVLKQIQNAAEEAQDVHRFLESAHNAFQRYQRRLKHYKEIAEQDSNLQIDSKGRISYHPSNADDLSPQQATAQAKSYSQVVSDSNKEITEILDKASKADELLAWALRADPNGRGKGFTGDGVNSLDEAKKAREAAAADARRLTQLASIKHRELTLDELKEFRSLTRMHEGDPYFGEKLATGLGARGTMEFWQRNADEVQRGGERTRTLEGIQKSLGLTLATASHSDSPAMKDWKHDVIRLGSHRFEDPNMAQHGQRSKGPYGFQIMSSLMRHGEFETKFLHEYGKGYGQGDHHVSGLIEFDKAASKDGSLKDFWTHDGEYQAMLNLGKGGDKGMDPLAGYMEALGHNHEAAQGLFEKKNYEYEDGTPKPNADLQYLLEERKWPQGNSISPSDHSRGYDELGHALEAATLGRAYDEPELGVLKSPSGANIMAQSVEMVASDPGFLEDRDGLGNSLAKMGAGYVDNLNWSVSNFGESDFGDETRNAAFGSLGQDDVQLSRENAARFMSMVGGDEDGYKILSTAEDQFAMNAIRGNPDASDSLRLTFETGAEAHGILDASRGEAIKSEAGEDKDLMAQKLSEAGEWKKYSGSQGISSVGSLLTTPLEASRVGSFAIPVVESVTGALETEQGIMIDREIERKQNEYDSKIDSKAKDLVLEFRSKGERASQDPMDVYLSANRHLENGSWYDDSAVAVKNGYSRGFGYR